LRALFLKLKMKVLIAVFLVCPIWSYAQERPLTVPTNANPQSSPAVSQPTAKAGLSVADEDTLKAKAVVQQGIEALGGSAYLNIHDIEQQGRAWGFHHGQSNGGELFWSFYEFPDKERVEYTKERDIARVFLGDKGYEITYRGVHPVEEKDMTNYRRQRHYALDIILHQWVNDPTVMFLYEGDAIAAQHAATQVTLINSKDEAVILDFDTQTHLPVRKAFEWRDPVDRQKNLEEEIYDNYKPVSGVMVPFNVTRLFNGDMSLQRFLFTVTINQPLDEAMFNPNSGYNPNKPAKK
jgi:hypothetical protein